MRRASILLSGSKYKGWAVVLGILTAIYCINFFTPFRLTNDTIRYFILKEAVAGTLPAGFGTINDFLPYGYVWFLLVLSWLKVLSPFTIALVQFGYFAGSLYFVSKLFSSHIQARWLVLFSLLNWTAIKFTVTPLSEMQFLFFSMGTLWYYQQFIASRRLKYLAALLVFAGVAVLTRTAGVVLVLALLFSYCLQQRYWLLQKAKQHKGYALLFLLAITGLMTWLYAGTSFREYLHYIFSVLQYGPWFFFTTNLSWHLTDWAELFLNVPYSKTSALVPAGPGLWLYMLAGLFFLVVVLRKLFSRQYALPLAVKVYLVAYMLLIFNWPFYEARFWVPVMPLALAVLLMRKKPFTIGWKLLAGVYVLTGLFALGYYTWISFDKQAMATKHDAGLWRAEYDKHFFQTPVNDSLINPQAMYILEKYDR